MVCGANTAAAKRYQRRVMVTMTSYLAVVLAAAWIVKHGHPVGWHLYFWSLLPAVPVMAVLGVMGRYLQEENDEYQRMLVVRSLLAGTALLMGIIVVSDFLRAFAAVGALPPFLLFVAFFLAFGLAQVVQTVLDRAPAAE